MKNRSLVSKRCRQTLIRRLATVILLIAAASTAVAQTTPTDGFTPKALAPGAPAGSYALSGFENVNLFNGSLGFHLPLLAIGGRGSAGYTITLPIEQKWQVLTFAVPFPGSNPILSPIGEFWPGLEPGYGPGVLQG